MEESILKTKFQKGFTLIEGILAISIAALGLVLIFSLIAMSLDIAVKSEYRLKDAEIINCLADQLRNEIAKGNQDIDSWLKEAYPEFILLEYYQTESLWIYKIEHNGENYYIVDGGNGE